MTVPAPQQTPSETIDLLGASPCPFKEQFDVMVIELFCTILLLFLTKGSACIKVWSLATYWIVLVPLWMQGGQESQRRLRLRPWVTVTCYGNTDTNYSLVVSPWMQYNEDKLMAPSTLGMFFCPADCREVCLLQQSQPFTCGLVPREPQEKSATLCKKPRSHQNVSVIYTVNVT